MALRNEVDSFNPFLGIVVPSFEAWALTYDYMIGYDNTDMSPSKTGLATDWQPVGRRPDLDVRHP